MFNNSNKLLTALLDTPALATIGAATFTLVLLYFVRKTPAKDAPAKSTIGVIQTVQSFIGKDAPWFLLDLQRTMGTSIFQLNVPLPGGLYVVGKTKHQREIQLDKATDKATFMYKPFEGVTGGPSMFSRSTFDEQWRHVRKGTAPAFASREINRINVICAKYANKFADEVLESLAGTDKTFDPSIECPKLIFHSVMEASFEYISTDEEYHAFSANATAGFREFTHGQAVNPLRKAFGFMIPEVQNAHKAAKGLADFAHKVLVAYRNNPNKSKNNTLIKLIENNSGNLTDKEKESEMFVYMTGGYDTTGYTISNTLRLLAKHPDKMKALQKSLTADTNQSPNAADEHMKRVVAESNRLMPVAAAVSIRQPKRDFVFVDESNREVKIPSGAMVCLPQVLAHRDTSVFGEDVDEFKPDRWTNASKEMMQTVTMFALGNRNCIAQSLAIAELYSVLPTILSKYEFELVEEGDIDFFLTWKYLNVKLRVKKAGAAH